MNGIQIKNNCILFYGNTAGYIENRKAVVDPMFQCEELTDYLAEKQKLEVQWTDGVFDRMANGKPDLEGNAPILKNCRIYQLKPDVDIMMKFISYNELLEHFGEPSMKDYSVVYDGQLETNDLEAIYEKFNIHHPTGFQGHSLSMSDVVELYDSGGSAFHYVDRYGFKEIEFQSYEQEQQNGQSMNL